MSENLEYIDEFARESMRDFTMGSTSGGGWDALSESLTNVSATATQTSFLSNFSDAIVQFFANKVYLVSTIVAAAGIGYGIFALNETENTNRESELEKTSVILSNEQNQVISVQDTASVFMEEVKPEVASEKKITEPEKTKPEEKKQIKKRDTVTVHKNVVVRKKVVLQKKVVVQDTVQKK